MEIYIDVRCGKPFPVEYEKLIEMTIKASLEYEKIKFDTEISVSIVDETEIQDLNKRYRNKDAITDVLSFPLYTPKEVKALKPGNMAAIGDIIICYERALEQAKEYGHSIEREISFLTAHSMLHLLGYDHENKKNEEEMFEKQESILKNLSLCR